MGLYDRDYTQADFHQQFRGAPQMRMSFPRLTPVVKWLLIINVAIYFIVIVIPSLGVFIYDIFQLDASSLIKAVQPWRLISYQFLHDPYYIWHILFNMLGLFFLGPTLERHWGSRKFLGFYLGCGIAGGLFYLLLVAMNFLPGARMVGASGAILGMLAACAILFPHFVVFFLFFPVPIRVAAIILILIATAIVLSRGSNAGGEAAHLAGMAAGATYVFSESWRAKVKLKLRAGQYQKKVAAQSNFQAELDRILKKVHDNGIHSLTSKEKKTLKKATKAEQMRNNIW